MNILETPFEGLFILEPSLFKDERGYFFESYNQKKLEQIIPFNFVQDNQSLSQKNVLRGMHFQKPPYDQGKLVRVIKGSALDVVIDIREKSKTFGQYYSIILSEENQKMFWVPPGFAHGFLSLMDDTIFFYKCTNFYHKESEKCILWSDPTVNINWGMENPLMAPKDKEGELLKDLPYFF